MVVTPHARTALLLEAGATQERMLEAISSRLLICRPLGIASSARRIWRGLLDTMMSDRQHPVPAEVEKRIGAVKGARHEARDTGFFLLIFRHGWRVSEACGLALSQMDIARRVLHVHQLQEGLSTTHPLRGDALSPFSVSCIGRGPLRSVCLGAFLVRGHPLGHPFALIPGHAPSVMRSLSLGVVENNAERVTVSRPDAADAMAEMHAIHSACPLHRALMHREQHAVPLP